MAVGENEKGFGGSRRGLPFIQFVGRAICFETVERVFKTV